MKSRFVRFLTLLVGIILLAAIIFAMSGEPGAASGNPSEAFQGSDNAGGNVSSKSISKLSSSESQPWTQERMQAAQPYPLEPLDSELEFSLQFSQPQGEPAFLPGSPPAADLHGYTVQQEPQSISLAAAAGYDYPAPFARYQNFDSYQIYPYSTVGVLFFRQYEVDYRCSAASIGNYAVWTAGHCVHNGDNREEGWSTNVVFAPAYKNFNAPFGVWKYSHVITTNTWYALGNPFGIPEDMGGVILKDSGIDSGNKKISEVVGSLGFAYNLNQALHWQSIGYPSTSPFNGLTQQICAGSFAYFDTGYSDNDISAPLPVAMGCDMTGGSSGGPWIWNFSGQVGATNYLNGNNSYRHIYHPQEMFSPYFGAAAKSLHDELLAASPKK